MRTYRKIFKEMKTPRLNFKNSRFSRLRESQALNLKDKQLENFYISVLPKLGYNLATDLEGSDIVDTARLIDYCGMSDRDAIYFAKLNIYLDWTHYNYLDKVQATQKWDNEGILLLTDLCNLNDNYNDFENEYVQNVYDDMKYADEWISDPTEDDVKDSWCDEVREQGCYIEINSQHYDQVGMVSCGMWGDGYEFKYDIKDLLSDVKIDYATMDKLFNSLPQF